MYPPNQYGNQQIGFSSGQTQAPGGVPPYPPQSGAGGLPYSIQPSVGFAANQSPYPAQAQPGYPSPQLPGSNSGGGFGYPSSQSQPGYPPAQTGYPTAQTGYPNPQPGPYPSQPAGFNPQSQSAYPPVATQPPVGAYPPASTGYSPYPVQPSHGLTSAYPTSQPSAYPTSQPSAYPTSQPSAYPTSLPSAYPTSQPSAYPTSQPSAYPNLPNPAYGANAPPLQSSVYHPTNSAYPANPGFGSSAPPVASAAYPYSKTQAHSYGATPHAPGVGLHHSGVGGHTMQAYVERPTIVAGPFDPASDAQILRKAMKGIGTDEAAILNVICRRTNAQRLQIANTYKSSFGKDLIKDLKSELGGRFEDVVLALMTPRFDYLAKTLQNAISGLGTKDRALVDIVCTATNEEIRLISASYTRLFGRTMERDLSGDTSGHFRRLLVSMSCAGRIEAQPADPALATQDAQALYNAGQNKIGTDEATFNQILVMRSFPHLRLVFHEYERTYGRSFEKVIENEFSGDVESGLKAIVRCAKNRAAYFASRLHESFSGFGTKDDDLIFIMVTRSEIDMQNIKDEYQRNYNKALASAISSETSGDYKKALIALLGA